MQNKYCRDIEKTSDNKIYCDKKLVGGEMVNLSIVGIEDGYKSRYPN